MLPSFGWESIELAKIPPLRAGEIHVFAITLTPDVDWETRVSRVLIETEVQRAARFRFDEDRYRFQKTRAALRLLLAAHLRSGSTGFAFREGSHGKPYLDDPESDLQFNVSHTRGAAVLAFARGLEIGIDIEHSRRKVDVDGVGRRVFTPNERAGFENCGESSRRREFYRLWTAKEAYLKATGSGLSCDPASIETDLEAQRYSSAADPGEILPYRLKEIETENQFQICLAYELRDPPVVRTSELL